MFLNYVSPCLLFCVAKALVNSPSNWDVGTFKAVGQGLVKHTVIVDTHFQSLLGLAKERLSMQIAEELMSVSGTSIAPIAESIRCYLNRLLCFLMGCIALLRAFVWNSYSYTDWPQEVRTHMYMYMYTCFYVL